MDVGSAKLLAAGIALIALFGVGIGIGNIFSSFIQSVARNPSVQSELITPLYVGAALTEAVGILAFVISLIILFVF